MKLQAKVKSVGRELVVTRNAWGEYRLTYSVAAIQLVNDIGRTAAIERAEQCAYYTDDASDVLGTARKMHERFVALAKV